jgi:spermidine synthase
MARAAMTDETPAPGPARRPRWPVPLALGIGLALFCFGEATAPDTNRIARLLIAGGALATVIAALVAARTAPTWWPSLRARLDAHTDVLDALPSARLGPWIALASGAALFVELMVIRWHSSSFMLFAYYKNVSLLAAFLGLGIGYALASRRPVMTPLVLPALSAQIAIIHLLGFTRVGDQLQNPVAEQLAYYLRAMTTFSQAAITYGFLLVVFVCTALTCVPLGHLASRLMRRCPPLVAYGWNLAGSLGGIAAFSLLARAWSPPAVWLLAAAFALVPFLLRRPVAAQAIPSLAGVGLVLGLLAIPWRTDLVEVFSPYQYLSLKFQAGEVPMLRINHFFFQPIVDLREGVLKATPEARAAEAYFSMPYRFKPRPGRVLLVGAGAGNDAAAAVRAQATDIDAVEIDPAMLEFGRVLHPERPYQNPKVATIVDDARGFIRHTDQRYDLIVYALLASHTASSGMSSVRLDSFVYTVEAFREARARLTPDGVLSMSVGLISLELGKKLYLMLTEAFDGQPPRVFSTGYHSGTVFVNGAGIASMKLDPDLAAREVTDKVAPDGTRIDVSTDDWPFFYMPVRRYPVTYVVMIAILGAASWLLLRQLMPLERGRFSAACFFLGAGFMLVETKGITELALAFGNTWEVVSAVIAGILVMAFLANWLIMRVGAPHPGVSYGLLGAALLTGMVVSGASFPGMSPLATRLLATAIVTLPLFFSGFAFSAELDRQGDVSSALSSNLLGAMLGGFLEYNSMYFGFRSLYLVAAALYALAFASSLRAR